MGSLLLGAIVVGLGSAVFHPGSSRVARLASGGRHELAQSLFQVGGNPGSAIGPRWRPPSSCCRADRPVSRGSRFAALTGMIILWRVGVWYSNHRRTTAGRKVKHETVVLPRVR